MAAGHSAIGEQDPLGEAPAGPSPESGPYVPAVAVFDVKGPTWEPGVPCTTPLEVAVVVTKGLHGKIINEASHFVSYPLSELDDIQKSCHVSLIREGGTMGSVREASKWQPVLDNQVTTQMLRFFVREVFQPLTEAGCGPGDIYMPIWNEWYERGSIPILKQFRHYGYTPRTIEMKDLSAWLVYEFGLELPERSEWTSLQSCHWYLERMRELFPARRKKRK